MFKFNPDPLFYTVGFEPRTIKATEKQLVKIYRAGIYGYKKEDEIATFSGLKLEEYRQLCEADHRAASAALNGFIDGKTTYIQSMMKKSDDGDTKANAFILERIYGMAAPKAETSEDNTVTIVVKNAEVEPT